jgi:hypothetical protein
MIDLFASPKRRIARANDHLADIKARTRAFFDAQPYAQIVEHKPDGSSDHKLKLTEQLPDVITDIAYEAIEALRSSLDQAMHPVAVACKSKRPDLIHFPIVDTDADFENVLNGRVKDFPQEILDLIRSFKPYQSGNKLVWALNRIRRQSTHRLIVPVGMATNELVIKRLAMRRGPFTIPRPIWDGEKNELIYLKTGPGADLDMDIEFTFHIAFSDVEGIAGERADEILRLMADEVERIVLAIEAESKRIGLI